MAADIMNKEHESEDKESKTKHIQQKRKENTRVEPVVWGTQDPSAPP